MTDRKKTKVNPYKYCCEGHDEVEICEGDDVIRAVGSLRSRKGVKFKGISGPSKINGKDKIYIHELKKYKSCNKYNSLHEDEIYSEYTKQLNILKKKYPRMQESDLLVLLEENDGHVGKVEIDIIKSKQDLERKLKKEYKERKKTRLNTSTSDKSRKLSANKKKKKKKSKKKKKKKSKN